MKCVYLLLLLRSIGASGHPLLPKLPEPTKPSESSELSKPSGDLEDPGRILVGVVTTLPSCMVLCMEGEMVSVRGREALLVQIVTSKLSDKVECIQEPWGQRTPNGTFSGLLGRLAEGRADLLATALYPEELWSRFFDYTYPYAKNDLCVMVPKYPPIRQSALQSFSRTTWIMVLCGLVLFASCLYLGTKGGGWDPGRVLIETVGTFLTGSFNSRQRTLVTSVLFCLSCFSLIVLNAFQGAFMSFLSVPTHPKQTDTLRDFNERTSLVFTDRMNAELLRESHDGLDSVTEKLRFVRTYAEWADALRLGLERPDVGYVQTREHIDLTKRFVVLTETGSDSFHDVRQCVLSPAYVSLIMRKNWPLAQRFDRMLQRLVEAGISDFLYDATWREYSEFGIHPLATNTPKDPPRPLRWQHVSWAFICLFAGTLLSTTVFVLEVVSHWFSRRRLSSV